MSALRRKPLTPKSPNVAEGKPPKSRSPVRRRPSPPSKQASADPLQLQARLAASEMKRAQLERENALLKTDAEKKAATIATLRAELAAARRAAVAAAATAPAAAAAAAAAVRAPVAAVSSDDSAEVVPPPLPPPADFAAGALSGRVNPTGAVLDSRHAPRASSARYVPAKLAAPTKAAPASPDVRVLAEGFVPIEAEVDAAVEPPPPPPAGALPARTLRRSPRAPTPPPPPPADAAEAPPPQKAKRATAAPPPKAPRRSPRAPTPPPAVDAAVPPPKAQQRIPKKAPARRRRSVRLARADADESPAAADEPPPAPTPAKPTTPAEEPAPTPAKTTPSPASAKKQAPTPTPAKSAKKRVVIRAKSPAKPRTPAKTPQKTPTKKPSPRSLVASAATAWSASAKKASARKGRRSLSSPARTRAPTPTPQKAGRRRRSRSPPPPAAQPTPTQPTPRRSARRSRSPPPPTPTTVATDDYAGVLAWDGHDDGVLAWSPRSSSSPWSKPAKTPTPPKASTPLSKPLSGPRLSEDDYYDGGVLAWDGDNDGVLAWSPRASLASRPRASVASRASTAPPASPSVASPRPAPPSITRPGFAAATAAARAFGEASVDKALEPWAAAACAAEAAVAPPVTQGRVRFRRCDFSSVAPPCDVARGSERETEAAVTALGKAAAAGDALSAAIRTAPDTMDAARALRESLKRVSHMNGETGGAARFWGDELDAILRDRRDASPVRQRLGELCVSGLRFHLRRLLNAPPVPQNPATDGAIYDWSRSRVHTFLRVEISVGGEPSEGALATELAGALVDLSRAISARASPDSTGLQRVDDLSALARGALAHAFLHTLLTWPFLDEAVVEAGGWAPVERLAAVLVVHAPSAFEVWAPLADVSSLRARLKAGLGPSENEKRAALRALQALGRGADAMVAREAVRANAAAFTYAECCPAEAEE